MGRSYSSVKKLKDEPLVIYCLIPVGMTVVKEMKDDTK